MKQLVALIGVVVGASFVTTAFATPLDPNAFSSLGSYTTSANVVINTDTLTISDLPGSGVISGGIAVFDFTSFTVSAGSTVNIVGSRPVALLSRGTVDIEGSLLAQGGAGGTPAGGTPRAGGGIGGAGGMTANANGGSGGGIGGGGGGAGGSAATLGGGAGGSFGGFGLQGAGAGGGQPSLVYGNLLLALQGGSGGGGGGAGNAGLPAGGGGGAGGGAIEVGAIGAVLIGPFGIIDVRGGNGGLAAAASGGGGGGSGGGVLVHSDTDGVTVLGALLASGGIGGVGAAAGGGGGGGRIVIQGADVDAGAALLNVSGVGGAGSGTITIVETGAAAAVPEPMTALLLGTGLIALAARKQR